LKRAPRQIAQEIAHGLGPVAGIGRVEVAGGGYLNAYFDRARFWEAVKLGLESGRKEPAGMPALPVAKIIVEHSSINPNKAAHIGHVRNAVLATPWCGSCGTPGTTCRFRITLITRACRWRMW